MLACGTTATAEGSPEAGARQGRPAPLSFWSAAQLGGSQSPDPSSIPRQEGKTCLEGSKERGPAKRLRQVGVPTQRLLMQTEAEM